MLTGKTEGYEVMVSRRRSVPGALRTGQAQAVYVASDRPACVFEAGTNSRLHALGVGRRTEALKESDRVLFFGYSLPQIDIEAEKLFQRSLSANAQLPWVGVVDPSPETARQYVTVLPDQPLRRIPSVQDAAPDD